MAQSENSSKRIVIQNTIFLYMRMFLTIVVGLYASRVVLRVLGESDFGIYSLVGGIVLMLNFLNAGMLQASQRFMAFSLGKGDIEEINKTFWASWYAHLILSGLIILIGETIGLYIINNILSIPAERLYAANWVYQASILTCAVSILSVPYNSAIVAHEKMKFFAYVSILEALLKLFIIYFLLIVSLDKLILYAVLMFSIQTIVRFAYSIYCNIHFKECTSKRIYDQDTVKKILSFAGWSFLGNMGMTCKDQGTNMLLNIFFHTPVINAARGIATQVNSIISTFAKNITMALNPQIVKTHASGQAEESKALVMIGSRAAFFMLTLLIIPLITNIDYVLSIWLEEVPRNTQLFMYFILGSSLIYAMSQPVTVAIQATGNIRNFQIWIFAFAALEILMVAGILWTTGSLIYAMVPSIIMQFAALIMRIIIIRSMQNCYSIKEYMLQVVTRCLIVLGVSYSLAKVIHTSIRYNNFGLFLAECIIIGLTTLLIICSLGLKWSEIRVIVNKVRKRSCQN